MLFQSSLEVLFQHSFTVLLTIDQQLYLDLEDGPPLFKQHFSFTILLLKKHLFHTYGASNPLRLHILILIKE